MLYLIYADFVILRMTLGEHSKVYHEHFSFSLFTLIEASVMFKRLVIIIWPTAVIIITALILPYIGNQTKLASLMCNEDTKDFS